MSFKQFDDTELPSKSKPEPKKNWNDPDIVNTELTLPKYYYSSFHSVFGDLRDQFKKSIWGIMNHCDNATQKTELKEMVEFLEELTRNTKEFIEKWEKAHKSEDD